MCKFKCFMAVTADEKELPLASFGSYEELSKFIGRSLEYVRSAIRKKSTCREYNCKFIVVNIKELYEEELASRGFLCRDEYLASLSRQYNIDFKLVKRKAKELGCDNDFDLLVAWCRKNVNKNEVCK